jgi:hypothetical protein
VPNAPAALRVKIENTQVSHHRFTGSIRPSLRDGFNGLLRALPGDRAFLSPSPADCLCRLDISVEISGPRGFAVRIDARRLRATQRPSHPAPNVRDDREAPLLRCAGRPKEVAVICPTEQVKMSATRWHDGQISSRRSPLGLSTHQVSRSASPQQTSDQMRITSVLCRFCCRSRLRQAANRDSVVLTRIAARSIHDGPSEE